MLSDVLTCYLLLSLATLESSSAVLVQRGTDYGHPRALLPGQNRIGRGRLARASAEPCRASNSNLAILLRPGRRGRTRVRRQPAHRVQTGPCPCQNGRARRVADSPARVTGLAGN